MTKVSTFPILLVVSSHFFVSCRSFVSLSPSRRTSLKDSSRETQVSLHNGAKLRGVRQSHALSSSRLDYVHGYHAGNYADVVKHSILILLLESMLRKDSPFVYVETHAGAGAYPLNSPKALKMKEFEGGIGRVLELQLPLVDPLSKLVGMITSSGEDNYLAYPGSPSIANQLCRPQDSLLLFERAQEPFQQLCSHLLDSIPIRNQGSDPILAKNARISISHDDGYIGLEQYARSTPKLPRALVFIDPPFQFGSDAQQMVRLVQQLHQHWKSARIVMWCPASNLLQAKTQRMLSELKQVVPSSDILTVELYPEDSIGTCMVMVNPPFGVDNTLKHYVPQIGQILRDDPPTFRIKWL